MTESTDPKPTATSGTPIAEDKWAAKAAREAADRAASQNNPNATQEVLTDDGVDGTVTSTDATQPLPEAVVPVSELEDEDEDPVVAEAEAPRKRGECPAMPLDYVPKSIKITMAEGPIVVEREIVDENSADDLASILLEMRAELWAEMWRREYQTHDMTVDPDTGTEHCSKCHAPAWQVAEGISCKPKVFDEGATTDGETDSGEA